jgi:cysteine-rich repeat protein
MNKKAISVMVGYILLIVFAIIISVLVFQWLRTYVPTEPLGCPDGVSIFIKEAGFNVSNSILDLIIKNNGRFDIGGYFIHAKNSSIQELAIIDLSEYLNENYSGTKFGNSVTFSPTGGNTFEPNEEETHIFIIPPEIGELYSVRVIPTRFQEEDNRQRFVSCGDSLVEQLATEPGEEAPPPGCIPDTCVGLGYEECGPGIVSDGCGGTINCPDNCIEGYSCNPSGQCEPDPDCSDNNYTCQDFGYVCGSLDICGVPTPCGDCDEGFSCSAGECVSDCGDGIQDPGEECDDGNTVDGDGCSSTCQDEYCGDGEVNQQGEQCDDGNTNDDDACKNDCSFGVATGCSIQCVAHQDGYSWGWCTTNTECDLVGGVTPFIGNSYCGAGQGFCCCVT